MGLPYHRLNRVDILERNRQMVKLRKEGVSIEGLSVRFRISKSHVRTILEKSGLTGFRPNQ